MRGSGLLLRKMNVVAKNIGVPAGISDAGIGLTGHPVKVLAELIAAAGEAKAKSLKVRISTAAKTRWEMPESIQEANVLGNLIGSPPVVNTIGTVEVAALAASVAGVVVAAMTVTFC
jgi:hypothetical protein